MSVTRVEVAARSPFVELAEGIEVSRSISDAGVGTLGGGHLRFVADATLEGTLEYDEVLHVLTGEVSIAVDEHTETGTPGDILLIPNGAQAVYRAVAGTELFYVITPRPA